MTYFSLIPISPASVRLACSPTTICSAVAGYRHFGMGFGINFDFCFTRTRIQFRPSPFIATSEKPSNYVSKAESNQPKSARSEIPVISDCFSQQEGDDDTPLERSPYVAGGIVALGKFDALHIGHRELAIQAAKAGTPYLLSFVGMAEVFGWEPRDPIVAKCDRKRVLSLWAPYCGNIIPTEYEIEFSTVRHLTPRQFVEKLSKELGVRGVVAGENYRFGYRAAGDSSELVKLCEEYEMDAFIIKSVMDNNQNLKILGSNDSKERGQVSSTRVRHALAMGEIKYVTELLGRRHRLILTVKDEKWFSSDQYRVSIGKSCMLNLPPKQGFYENCFLFIGSYNFVPCRVTLDATHIHLELDDISIRSRIVSQDYRCGPYGVYFCRGRDVNLNELSDGIAGSQDARRALSCVCRRNLY